MTISYLLAPIPKWYIADLTGKPLGGGFMKTYHANNKTVVKPVFQDSSGINVWPFPILFDENGSQGPFYWQVDSTNLTDTYYLEVYDAAGVLQWTIDNYFPPGAGGGGSVTTALSIEDLVINNVFLHHNADSTNPIAATSYYLAPGAHSGLTLTSSRCGPDIYFFKSNTSATDQLRFIDFTLNSTPFTGDVTPETYLNYKCTGAGSAEVDKFVQFPITHGVQNLVNQNAIATIWARCNGSAGQQITLQWCQFMGDGTGANPSIPIVNPIQTLTLTTSWAPYSVSANIPTLPVAAAIGPCHNDGLFLRITYPLSATCDIDFVKPSVFLGNIAPAEVYLTNDQIESTINTPRTGDFRESFVISSQLGWVPMNNGTVGNAASSGTARANSDTFPLYNLLYTINDTYAPVSGGRTGNAINDFTNNKTITLPRSLGYVVGGTNPNTQNQVVTLVAANTLTVASTTDMPTGTPIQFTTTGTLPSPLSTTEIYYAINVTSTTFRVAVSPDFAASDTHITLTGTGSGVITESTVIGGYFGEGAHVLTIPEMPAHTHEAHGGGTEVPIGSYPLFHSSSNDLNDPTSSTGNDQPHNTFQPTLLATRYIKL